MYKLNLSHKPGEKLKDDNPSDTEAFHKMSRQRVKAV